MATCLGFLCGEPRRAGAGDRGPAQAAVDDDSALPRSAVMPEWKQLAKPILRLGRPGCLDSVPPAGADHHRDIVRRAAEGQGPRR